MQRTRNQTIEAPAPQFLPSQTAIHSLLGGLLLWGALLTLFGIL